MRYLILALLVATGVSAENSLVVKGTPKGDGTYELRIILPQEAEDTQEWFTKFQNAFNSWATLVLEYPQDEKANAPVHGIIRNDGTIDRERTEALKIK